MPGGPQLYKLLGDFENKESQTEGQPGLHNETPSCRRLVADGRKKSKTKDYKTVD